MRTSRRYRHDRPARWPGGLRCGLQDDGAPAVLDRSAIPSRGSAIAPYLPMADMLDPGSGRIDKIGHGPCQLNNIAEFSRNNERMTNSYSHSASGTCVSFNAAVCRCARISISKSATRLWNSRYQFLPPSDAGTPAKPDGSPVHQNKFAGGLTPASGAVRHEPFPQPRGHTCRCWSPEYGGPCPPSTGHR